MLKIIILLFVLSAFLSYHYLTQATSLLPSLLSAHAQQTSEKDIDLTGIWQRDDGAQVNITQIDSEVTAFFLSPGNCEGEDMI